MAEIPKKDSRIEDPTEPVPVRVLGRDPMVENEEHTYGLDAADNSPAAFNLRNALEASGMMAGVAHGGRGHDNETLERQKEDRKNADAIISALNAEIQMEEAEYYEILDRLAEMYEDMSALEAELGELTPQADELRAQIEDLSVKAKAAQEKYDLANQAAEMQLNEGHQRFKELSDTGLPDRVLKIMHEEIPGACSMYDFQVAVDYDMMTGKYSYKMPDGTVHQITEDYKIKELDRQRNELNAVSADQLTLRESNHIFEYMKKAEAFQTTMKGVAVKWKEADDALKELNQYTSEIEVLKGKLDTIEARIAAINTEMEDLQKRIDADEKLAAEKLAHINELKAQRDELGIERTSVMSNVQTNYSTERLEQLQTKVEETRASYKSAYDKMEEEFNGSVDQLLDSKKWLKDSNVAMVSRDVVVKDENGKTVYDEGGGAVTRHLDFAVQQDDKGYFYTDTDGERKTIAPQEVTYLLENGQKTLQQATDNDPYIFIAADSLEAANRKIMSSSAKMETALAKGDGPTTSASGAELSTEAGMAKMNIMASKTMMGAPSEERAQDLTAQWHIDEALKKNPNAITTADFEKALNSVDPSRRDAVRERLKDSLVNNSVAIADTPTAPKIFSGVDPVPQNISAVDPNLPVVSADTAVAATSIDPREGSLSSGNTFGKAANQPASVTPPTVKTDPAADAVKDAELTASIDPAKRPTVAAANPMG